MELISAAGSRSLHTFKKILSLHKNIFQQEACIAFFKIDLPLLSTLSGLYTTNLYTQKKSPMSICLQWCCPKVLLLWCLSLPLLCSRILECLLSQQLVAKRAAIRAASCLPICLAWPPLLAGLAVSQFEGGSPPSFRGSLLAKLK